MVVRTSLVIWGGLALAGCDAAAVARDEKGVLPAGSALQEGYDPGAFTSISLVGHADVLVELGAAFSVRAVGPQEEIDRLDIRSTGGDLRIGVKDAASLLQSGKPGATVFVTMPSLSKASIGGSGNMRIGAVGGRSFDAAIGGSGDMELVSLRADVVRFSVGGAGSIKAMGRSNDTEITLAGSGDIDLSGFETRNASISVAGSGGTRLRASQHARLNIMGTGDVTVYGGAKCSRGGIGRGAVSCGEQV